MVHGLPPIIVMGVQGSGKSTIGARLADRLGVPFLDGDDLHSDENRRRMASGVPLTDELRRPWLDEIGRRLAEASGGVVIACSALKREYRDRLRAAAPETFVVHPAGPIEVVAERIGARTHEFMPPELLRSQYETLEELADDERGLVLDLRQDPDDLVEEVAAALSEPGSDEPGVDVLAVGETMLLVAPAAGASFALGSAMTISPAGAEANVAVGCAGLGLRAAWYSRLGADAIGELLLDGLAARDVDTSLVTRSAAAPTGVMFKRPLDGRSEVAYYRAGSAASTMDASDLDALPVPRLVHVSGITAALSPSCLRLVDAIVVERRLGDAIVSFDVNHRPVLWSSPERAASELLRLARAADIVFVGRDEAERLWGAATAEAVRTLLPDVPHLVVKDAEHEAVEFAGDTVVRVATPPVEVVETVGAGDGFAAGWITALLRDDDTEGRLAAGHAMAAAVLRSSTDHAEPAALRAALATAPRPSRAPEPNR